MTEPAPSNVLVEMRGVTVRRGGRAIIDDIQLTVGAGEIVTLIGPNGAGKTTAVRLALGLEQPDDGKVIRRSGLKIGYQPQKFHIDQTMPLPVRRLLTLTQRYSEADMISALQSLGVGHLIDADVHALSGGELQRVSLARAFLRKPDLLVLDEPTQNLDIGAEVEVYKLIRQVRDVLGCGVLLVSHDLNVVMAATTRVYCLNGHVCCSGHPDHVSQHPEFLRLFGAKASETLAVYTHDHDHVHAPDGHPLPPDHDHHDSRHHHGHSHVALHPGHRAGHSHSH